MPASATSSAAQSTAAATTTIATRCRRDIAAPFPETSAVRSGHAVLLEPGEAALPAVLRRIRAIARPVVGVEAVRRAVVDDQLARLLRVLERLAHLVDVAHRDALVRAAVETEHRRLQLADELEGMLRSQVVGGAGEDAIPRDARFEIWAVRVIEPHDAPAVAESGDAELLDVAAVVLGPLGGGVE